MSRPSWPEYFMSIARLVATRSTCLRRAVGAVLVKDKRILATGYNGVPTGIRHCEENGCLRESLEVKPGDKIHILYRLPPEPKGGLIAHRAGSAQVKVEAGNLVVVYIDDSKHRGFYRPLAEGSSVVVVRPPAKEQTPAEKVIEKQ